MSLGLVWAPRAAEGCFCGHRDHLCEHQACLWWFRHKLPAKICSCSFSFSVHLPDKFISVLNERRSRLELLKIKPVFLLDYVYLFLSSSCLCSTWTIKSLLSGCWTFRRTLCNSVTSAFPLSFSTHFGILVCGSVRPQCGCGTVPVDTTKHSQYVHTCIYMHVIEVVRNLVLQHDKHLPCCCSSAAVVR